MAVVGKNSSYPAVFSGANTKNEKSMSRSWYFSCKNAGVFMKKLPKNHMRNQLIGKRVL